MIGTIEALGVFVLAILPGFLARRTYGFGKPPLRTRGALGDLGSTIFASAVGWTALYVWRGQTLLPIVLGQGGHTTSERLDAFAELAALSVVLGLVLGAVARVLGDFLWLMASRVLKRLDTAASEGAAPARVPPLRSWARRWLAELISAKILPGYSWDRLLSRLATRGERVICRVKTKSGDEVLGVFARNGWLDWEADGRNVLFDKEVIRNTAGELEPVAASRGLFVPGDEVSSLSVVGLPDELVQSEDDG